MNLYMAGEVIDAGTQFAASQSQSLSEKVSALLEADMNKAGFDRASLQPLRSQRARPQTKKEASKK